MAFESCAQTRSARFKPGPSGKTLIICSRSVLFGPPGYDVAAPYEAVYLSYGATHNFLADLVSTICSDASAYLPSDYQFSLKPPTLSDYSVGLMQFPPEPMSYSYVIHVHPGALSDVYKNVVTRHSV